MRNEPLPENLQHILDVRRQVEENEMWRWVERQEELARPKHPRLHPHRLLMDLSIGRINGEDREVCEEAARRDGQPFDPQRPYVSIRDLNTAVSSAGGVLKATDLRPVVDILRPTSVIKQAGLVVESGLAGDAVFPKTIEKTTPVWLSTETSTVTASQPTLSQVAMTPKTVGIALSYSRQLSKQAHANRYVGQDLLRTLGSATDQVAINGLGSSGQPLGLLNTPGVQTQPGATLNAGVSTMKRKAAEANANDEAITFIATPAVRELLESRERATGGGRFVWDQDRVADRRAYVSTDVPASTMICGDWSLVYLGIWGEGFTLEVNPFDPAGFKSGLIQARMLVACDVAVLHPSAFVVATSIT